MDTDVLVIGGGFAGLVAARDLRAAGRGVILVEARDRLGGRTWYAHSQKLGTEVEYGGTWFSREAQPSLAAEIARYGVAVSPQLDPTWLAWFAEGTLRSGPTTFGELRDVMRATGGPVDEALARVRDGLNDGDLESLSDLDVSAARWIGAAPLPPAARDFLLAYTSAMGGGRADEQSWLSLLVDAAEGGYRFEDAFSEVGESFADGTKSLVDAIAADGSVDIRPKSPVSRIRHRDGIVAVDLEGGGEIVADAAVVALPVNVWREVAFDPALVGPHDHVAARGHVGRACKILAAVEGVPEGFLSVGWPTLIQAAIGGRELGQGRRLVTAFACEQPIDPHDASAVEAALRVFLPGAKVAASDGHDWVGDPWSRGTWLSIPAGWDTSSWSDLTKPLGRMVFAGSDIAPAGAGWMEGAIVSGRLAAERVLALP